jgi:hypothetical protein
MRTSVAMELDRKAVAQDRQTAGPRITRTVGAGLRRN